MPEAPTVRQRVEKRLRARACVPIPYGFFTGIAEEIGCSRQYVARIAREIGIGAPVTRAAGRFGCGSCGSAITRLQAERTGLCRPCRLVTLPCESCGEPVTRDVYLLHKPRRSDSPRLFCNRQCLGQWLGRNHGFGRPDRHAPRSA